VNADEARAVRLISVGGQVLRIRVRSGDPRRTPLLLVRGPAELPDRTGAYVWRVALGPSARSIRMPLDPGPYATQLYRVLHQLDQENWPWIAVEFPPDAPDWTAIRDRLRRAEGGAAGR